MINTGVKHQTWLSLVGISGNIPQHILVDKLLQVHANRSIGANNFIGADSCFCGNVSIGVGNADVRAIIADGVMCALDGRSRELSQKILLRACVGSPGLRRNLVTKTRVHYEQQWRHSQQRSENSPRLLHVNE